MKEEWRDIQGFEGSYQVSNLGRVRSFDRVIMNNIGVHRIYKSRIMKYFLDKDGYENLTLNKLGKQYKRKVHRLVAAAFIDNPENKESVNHKDLNKKNNRLENLEWVTKSENMIHAAKNNKNCRGEGIAQSKLSEEDVLIIRELYLSKQMNQKELSEKYKVTQSSISCIVLRKTWSHI